MKIKRIEFKLHLPFCAKYVCAVAYYFGLIKFADWILEKFLKVEA